MSEFVRRIKSNSIGSAGEAGGMPSTPRGRLAAARALDASVDGSLSPPRRPKPASATPPAMQEYKSGARELRLGCGASARPRKRQRGRRELAIQLTSSPRPRARAGAEEGEHVLVKMGKKIHDEKYALVTVYVRGDRLRFSIYEQQTCEHTEIRCRYPLMGKAAGVRGPARVV